MPVRNLGQQDPAVQRLIEQQTRRGEQTLIGGMLLKGQGDIARENRLLAERQMQAGREDARWMEQSRVGLEREGLASKERLGQAELGSLEKRAQIGADTSLGVAGISAESNRDVATTQADASRDVAETKAEADVQAALVNERSLKTQTQLLAEEKALDRKQDLVFHGDEMEQRKAEFEDTKAFRNLSARITITSLLNAMTMGKTADERMINQANADREAKTALALNQTIDASAEELGDPYAKTVMSGAYQGGAQGAIESVLGQDLFKTEDGVSVALGNGSLDRGKLENLFASKELDPIEAYTTSKQIESMVRALNNAIEKAETDEAAKPKTPPKEFTRDDLKAEYQSRGEIVKFINMSVVDVRAEVSRRNAEAKPEPSKSDIPILEENLSTLLSIQGAFNSAYRGPIASRTAMTEVAPMVIDASENLRYDETVRMLELLSSGALSLGSGTQQPIDFTGAQNDVAALQSRLGG
jgi:hypothetical protein